MLADIDRLNDDVVKKFREVVLHAYLDSCRIKSVVDDSFFPIVRRFILRNNVDCGYFIVGNGDGKNYVAELSHAAPLVCSVIVQRCGKDGNGQQSKDQVWK